MFKELLGFDSTKEFIDKLYTYEIYKGREYSNYDLIGIFYDAVYKYALIIDNIFSEGLNIDKLLLILFIILSTLFIGS